MDKDVELAWERFLNPEILRTNLVVASLYITAYEMLKNSIIDRIYDFYTCGFDENGLIISPQYESKVLSLSKSRLYASLEWLKKSGAINEGDIEDFERIKECRNKIAHEITYFLTKGLDIDPLPLFSKITDLLYKLEKWWIVNVEISINPVFDGKDVDEEGIVPGPIMTLRLLTDIALGTEQESKFYYNEFIKRKNGI